MPGNAQGLCLRWAFSSHITVGIKNYLLPNVTGSDPFMQGMGDLENERLVERKEVSMRKNK